MPKRTSLYLVVALALGGALPATSYAAGTIESSTLALGRNVADLLAFARARSPSWRAAQAEAQAAAERIQPAGALPDPMFKVELMDLTNMGETGVQLSPAKVGSTQYTLSQQIPFWGKRDLRRGQAEAEARAATRTADGMWLELATEVKRTYAQYWLTDQNLRLTGEIQALLGKMERVARTRYASGLAAQQDVIRAQVELTMVRQELVSLESEQQGMKAMLNGLIGRDAMAPLAQPDLRAAPPAERTQLTALFDRLVAQNPALAAERERVNAAEQGRALAAKNWYPDLNFGVTPVQRGNQVNEWQLMFEVNIPLQFESRRSQEREADRMLQAARSRVEAANSKLAGELGGAVAALNAARRTEHLIGDTLIAQSEATFEAALAGYETGRVDFATLLDAQRAIRKAKQDLYKAQAEQQLRLADIERIVGDEL